MKVRATIEMAELEGDYGPVDGLTVTCERCGHSVEIFGRSESSELRGAAQLREECPRGEKNFYKAE